MRSIDSYRSGPQLGGLSPFQQLTESGVLLVAIEAPMHGAVMDSTREKTMLSTRTFLSGQADFDIMDRLLSIIL